MKKISGPVFSKLLHGCLSSRANLDPRLLLIAGPTCEMYEKINERNDGNCDDDHDYYYCCEPNCTLGIELRRCDLL